MSVYDVGDSWSRTFTVKDSTGALADAGTFTCTVTQPDGTAATVGVVHQSTGTYLATVAPLAQAGLHQGYAASTGTNISAQPFTFNVRPAVSTSLLSLEDAKSFLRIQSTLQDDDLQDTIDVVTDLIEGHVGAVIPRTVTRSVNLSGNQFFLPGPVISLTSMTPVLTNGTAYTVGDFVAETSGGVTRADGCLLSGGTYTVVYQAGRQGPIPPTILQAARLLVQHLWVPRRGAGLSPGGPAPEAMDPTYLLTPDVMVLLRRYRQISAA